MARTTRLYGRVFIAAHIRAKTGLHIGGSAVDLEIGGLDKAVIRDPLTRRPYIPGSSLRGKMRSQLEKWLGLPQNRSIGNATIHTCTRQEDFTRKGGCPVCTVFGVPAELDFASPTRLVVRDAPLTDDSAHHLEQARLDLGYTELKTEVAIDRVTSVANPRTLERVPAGAVFGPAELVFNLYELPADLDRLKVVLEALQLVEDDYLGGSGSRGYGKVAFEDIHISVRAGDDYTQIHAVAHFANLAEWAANFAAFRQQLAAFFPTQGG